MGVDSNNLVEHALSLDNRRVRLIQFMKLINNGFELAIGIFILLAMRKVYDQFKETAESKPALIFKAEL